MAFRFGLCLSYFVVASSSSQSGSLGASRGLYGDSALHAEYTLNLQPPEESTHDVEASLDAVMKAEDEKRILSDTAFAAAKQRLINVEKQLIQHIVREVFEAKPTQFLQLADTAPIRQQVKDTAHRTSLEASLGEYERKTQSPMIWMNLHKTDLS